MSTQHPYNSRSETPYWVFTINNPTSDSEPREKLAEVATYIIWQKEVGEEGTSHLQGYVVFKKKKRLSAVKKLLPRAHLEPRRGSHVQAKQYSSKEDTRADGPWEFGDDSEVPKSSGSRSDLNEVKAKLDAGTSQLDIAKDHFGSWCRYRNSFQAYTNLTATPRNEAPKVYILWGPPGTGKSYQATQLAGPDAFWLPRPQNGDNLWWDGYQSGKNLVIDEFYSWIKYDFFLRMLDRYPVTVPIKGSTAVFNSPIIVITSNADPDTWYPKVPNRSALERRFREFCEVRHLQEPYNFAINSEE